MLIPKISGKWWTIAQNPDLGQYDNPEQESVDFGIWQAFDGTWQLWACIRNTKCGGKGRLFYRWQSEMLEKENWQPKGIVMRADPDYGETPGCLQSPYVIEYDGEYFMFYGVWNIFHC